LLLLLPAAIEFRENSFELATTASMKYEITKFDHKQTKRMNRTKTGFLEMETG
jgi:hypothetical protein